MTSFRSPVFILPALLAGFIAILPLTAQAARSYRVDLIVFTQPAMPDDPNGEQWEGTPPPLDAELMARAVTPSQLMEGTIPEVMTETGTDKDNDKEKVVDFTAVLNKLQHDPKRKILLVTSWVQPVDTPRDSPVIRITDLSEEALSAPATDSPPASTGMALTGEPPVSAAPPLLDGYVHFYVSGIYTLELDLRYTPEIPFLEQEDPENPQYTTYRIHEKRRMKSDELNYYDHPKFGVLLLVNPALSPQE